MALGVKWSGEPGTVWVNDTLEVWWQLHCSLVNTCAFCLPLHLAVSYDMWHTPFHDHCRCVVVQIEPGSRTKPYPDFRVILKEMPEAERFHAVGKSNWTLLRADVVAWDDLVVADHVLKFNEVVARQKLSVAEMVEIGIRRDVAERGYKTAHLSPEQIHKSNRAALLANVARAGKPSPAAVSPSPGLPADEWSTKSKDSGSRRDQIVAAHAILRRLGAGLGLADRMPNIEYDVFSIRDWVAATYPEHRVASLTSGDWLVLLMAAEAVDSLKATFRYLGVDVARAFERITP